RPPGASAAGTIPATPRTTPPPPLTTEMGIASWYGYPFHGRAAANGEIYDMEKLTAAHRTLPFGTWVRVTNLGNNKTVDVRITDRGPFIAGRIIDLSHAAAQTVELIGPGIAQVRLDVISAPLLEIADAKSHAQTEGLCHRADGKTVYPTRWESFGGDIALPHWEISCYRL